MKGRTLSLIAGSLVLVLGTLACVLNLGGPTPPGTDIPVSTDAATQAQQVLNTADAQAAQTGQMNFTLTEAQATAYLADQLRQQSTAMITDPQVHFRDGQVQVFGKASQGFITANVRIIVTIGVDPQGQPVIDIASADFGPFPVPPSLRDMITNSIRDAYASALGSAVTHFQLEKVTIADGTLTLTGIVK